MIGFAQLSDLWRQTTRVPLTSARWIYCGNFQFEQLDSFSPSTLAPEKKRWGRFFVWFITLSCWVPPPTPHRLDEIYRCVPFPYCYLRINSGAELVLDPPDQSFGGVGNNSKKKKRVRKAISVELWAKHLAHPGKKTSCSHNQQRITNWIIVMPNRTRRMGFHNLRASIEVIVEIDCC